MKLKGLSNESISRIAKKEFSSRKTASINRSDLERLRELQMNILDALEEASNIIRMSDRSIYERAKSYWLAHAKMAITKEHEYMGGSMVDMDDTIRELEDMADGDEDEDEYDDEGVEE